MILATPQSCHDHSFEMRLLITYAVSATVGTIYVRGGLEDPEIKLAENRECRTLFYDRCLDLALRQVSQT